MLVEWWTVLHDEKIIANFAYQAHTNLSKRKQSKQKLSNVSFWLLSIQLLVNYYNLHHKTQKRTKDYRRCTFLAYAFIIFPCLFFEIEPRRSLIMIYGLWSLHEDSNCTVYELVQCMKCHFTQLFGSIINLKKLDKWTRNVNWNFNSNRYPDVRRWVESLCVPC